MEEELQQEQNAMQEQAKKAALTPVKTWWIERTGDGMIFPADEQQAWNILTNRSRWTRNDFRVVGVGDGTTFVETLKNAKSKTQELKQELAEAKEVEQRYLKAEDRFRFEEILDEDDDRLKRATKKRKEASEKVRKLKKELDKVQGNIVKKAQDAEYEAAKGNIEMPSNHDVLTPHARNEQERKKILGQIGHG